MKCGFCDQAIVAPYGWRVVVLGKPVLMLICPHCQAALGAIPADE